MEGLVKKFERLFTAVAFAEAGEFETARQIMNERKTEQARKVKTERPQPRAQAPGVKR